MLKKVTEHFLTLNASLNEFGSEIGVDVPSDIN